MFLIVGSYTMVMLSGCAKQMDFTVTTYQGVERVMMHESDRWSFFAEGCDRPIEVRLYSLKDLHIKRDVAPNEKCWIEVGPPWVHNECLRLSLVIHLHSFKEINGAGWDHGKFGRGETTVLE